MTHHNKRNRVKPKFSEKCAKCEWENACGIHNKGNCKNFMTKISYTPQPIYIPDTRSVQIPTKKVTKPNCVTKIFNYLKRVFRFD